jgi:cytochrome oxidase Cu insertion factor (SCO1/SenC/PrrC family)
MRRLLAPFSLTLAFALHGCHVFGPPKDPADGALAEGPRVGQLAPDLEGEDIEGTRFRLSDYRGKVVVLDFWANY